jgi:hypothetical protein
MVGMRFSFRTKENKSSGDALFLGSSEHFEWRARAGRESVVGSDWIVKEGITFLERVYRLYKINILQLGDARKLPIHVVINPSSECQGGIGGATGNGELSYCAGNWGANAYCYGILAHELCNLFTGELVCPGWPEAWWANHRSPFPTMIANEALHRLVPEHYRQWGDYNDPLVLMFDGIYKKYSGVFPTMLQKMKELGVTLSRYGEPELSHVIYYFMFYAAGDKQIANYFVSPPMPPVNPTKISEYEGRFNLGVA